VGNEVNLIEATWLNFVKSLHPLLATRLDDRPLDQYLQFRDDVLALVEGPDFTIGLNSAWPSPPYPSLPPDQTRVRDLLLAELRAFPIAVEVAQAQEKASAGEKGWIGRWLGRAATITDSVKDIIYGQVVASGTLPLLIVEFIAPGSTVGPQRSSILRYPVGRRFSPTDFGGGSLAFTGKV